MNKAELIILFALGAALSACSKQSPLDGPTGISNRPIGLATVPPATNSTGVPIISGITDIGKDERPWDQLLCEAGKKFIKSENTADFSEIFSLICKENKLTADFLDTVENAFDGNASPVIKFRKSHTNEAFVSELLYTYAIKLPTGEPTNVLGTKPHDAFVGGIKKDLSEMTVEVLDREYFPAKRSSVEKVLLRYEMPKARGAGIYDVRTTEANTYLLSDTRKDVALQTEHILDTESNEYYHDGHDLMLVFTNDGKNTYIVRFAHHFVKNRVDPARLGAALADLNVEVVKMLHKHITTGLEAE